MKQAEVQCPGCGARRPGSVPVSQDSSPLPSPGDLSICSGCAYVGVYDAGGKLRRPDGREQEMIDSRLDVILARQRIRTWPEYEAYVQDKFQGVFSEYSRAHFWRSKALQAEQAQRELEEELERAMGGRAGVRVLKLADGRIIRVYRRPGDGPDDELVLSEGEWDQLAEAAAPEAAALLEEFRRVLRDGIDPDRLDLLADWFDADDARKGSGRGVGVQADLRQWARLLRGIQSGA
jgi:hypothetical protein